MYSYYTVKSGDTLSGIARKYDTTVTRLMALNPQIEDKNVIHTGQIIKVPYQVTITETPAPAPAEPTDYERVGKALEKCLNDIENLDSFKALESLL